MSWWCTATREPWSWEWRAYPGVWIAVALLAVPFLLSLRRHRAETGESGITTRQRWQFGSGVVVFWLATDWPVGTLGAGYLASVHMVQWMLYTSIVAPLLLLGMPEWMAERFVDRLHLRTALRTLSRPLVAGVLFNVVLIATHAPFAVDRLRVSAAGSIALDVAWFLSGLIVWLPIISPIRSLRSQSYPIKIVYLFLAMGVLPMFPGGFLTFATYPLYAIFELAPRATSLSATEDQVVAGLLMKIGSIPVIWPVVGVMFVRWARQESADDEAAAAATPLPPAAAA